MTTIKSLKFEILKSAVALFTEVGFLRFSTSEFARLMGIDVEVIKKLFYSKSGILLAVLSEMYIEFFAIDSSSTYHTLSIDSKKRIYHQLQAKHSEKIDLFISLFERNEIEALDEYLLKLLRNTVRLHFRLFMSQAVISTKNNQVSKNLKIQYFKMFKKLKIGSLNSIMKN